MRLSPAQSAILDMQQTAGGAVGNVCGYILFPRPYPLSALSDGLNRLLRENDALRVRLIREDGAVGQEAAPYQPRQFEVLRFPDREALDGFGEKLAEEPLPLFGELCDFRLILQEDAGAVGVLCRLHHIVGDAWSVALLGRQLQALLNGEEPRFHSYLDAVRGEWEHPDPQREERARRYFETALSETPERLLLSDAAPASFAARRLELPLSPALSRQIYEYCREQNIYPYALFLTALSAWLGKTHMLADRFLLGMTSLNRATLAENETVGLFVNTIPLPIHLSFRESFEENLNEVIDASFSALRHQRFNYSRLRRSDLAGSRGAPLYDLLFDYQTIRLPGMVCRWFPCGSQIETLQVHVTDSADEGVFRILYDYRTARMTEKQVATCHRHWTTLLQNALQEPSAPLSGISMLPAEERSRILELSAGPTEPYPRNRTLPELFEEQCGRTPDAFCLRGEDGNLRFREFRLRTEALDRRLRLLTGGKKPVVAVLSDRCPGLYVSVYAILRSGCVYLPVDPALPPRRIRFLLEDSGAAAVLAQEKYMALVSDVPALNVTEFLREFPLRDSPAGPLPVSARPEDPAYLLYTSGSTGAPKGVLIRQDSLINRLLWMQRRYPLGADGVILQKTPISFDVSLWELFWWGLCGGTLAYLPPGGHLLPRAISAAVEQQRVTHLHFVPSMLRVFLQYARANPEERKKFDTVRHVFVSGEALDASLVRGFHLLFPRAALHNLYGPAECTVDVSWYDCTGDEEDPVPIGRPIDNTRLYVLDPALQLLPAGVQGELCIAGDGVGVGYHNRPELTAERFLPDPYGPGRLYRTGDAACYDETGRILFRGRLDGQFKLHGQRIEPGEIEQVLLAEGGADAACVLLRQVNAAETLVAFCSGPSPDPERLRAYCAARLPAYMVPGRFVILNGLPVGHNGKVDRQKLKDLPLDSAEDHRPAAPDDPLERRVALTFQERLGTDSVGRDTNFLLAGGSSLSMVELLALNPLFAGLTAADFLRNPTPAGVAALLRERQNGEAEPKALQVLREGKPGGGLLVLIPFAGGDAGAFARLTEALSLRAPGLRLYAMDFPRSEDDCVRAAKELAETGCENPAVYAHCAGNAPALALARRMNGTGNLRLLAGAFVPPRRKMQNFWRSTPDALLAGILNRAGGQVSALPSPEGFLSDFRRDTDLAFSLLDPKLPRVSAPVSVLLGPEDPFTRRYRNPEQNWSLYAETVRRVDRLESGTHYFQSAQAETLADWIIRQMEE